GGAELANQAVGVTIKIDGKTYDAEGKPQPGEQPLTNFRTDAQGKLRIRFKLPTTIDRGDAHLAVTFNDGGPETITRAIPIVLKKLKVEFFPEGGYLVPGVVNRVYFQVRTPLDKPADLRGKIVDETGKVVVDDVQTLNDPD